MENYFHQIKLLFRNQILYRFYYSMEIPLNNKTKNRAGKKIHLSSKQNIRRISQEAKNQISNKHCGSNYLNRKLNTEVDYNKNTITKSKSSNRNFYCVSKGNIGRVYAINRNSYSRQHQNKFSQKTFNQQNRFTLNDFTIKNNKQDVNSKICSKPANRYQNSFFNKKYKSPNIRKLQGSSFKKKMIEIQYLKKEQNRIKSQSEQIFNEKNVQIIGEIGKGTFGIVFKARFKPTGEIVAIKKVLQDKKYKSREEQLIKLLKSPFTIRNLHSYLSYQTNSNHKKEEYLNIVMQCYQCNLYQYLQRNPNITSNTIKLKIILYQMFRGLMYIHSLQICHRDIKPHNMLIKKGRLSICDFGSAKILIKNEPNLAYICSRCYRAPQLIFGSDQYTTQIDMWSAGCIILQILNKVPLFIGQNSLDHLIEIIKIMGSPSKSEVLAMNPSYDLNQYDFPYIKKTQWQKLFPSTDPLLIDLLNKVMRYSPKIRFSSTEALQHQYFDQIRDEFTQSTIEQFVDTSGFFDFTPQEQKMMSQKKSLIPNWYQIDQ